ncbi:MAG: hypothetical protein WA019_02780 [Candidatus Moraniibacteriota bacterium]
MGKLKEFLIKHEIKLVLTIGFVLVALISFQTGYLEGRKVQGKSIIIENPTEVNINQKPPEGQNLPSEEKNSTTSSTDQSKNCAFVGSKNSNKYHLPNCRWAKSIKPENLVCFSDENDAKSKGYLPDKNCIK